MELDRGEDVRDVLKGIDLTICPGERVALMGRNGAGKSTLLRTAAGLHEPVAGKLEVGSIALLTQNPGDYLVRERVGDELPGDEGMAALRIVGLEHAIDADPRTLRRRAPAPRPGDRARRPHGGRGAAGRRRPRRADPGDGSRPQGRAGRLIDRLSRPRKRTRGAAVVVATHDVEFAAEFAERVVLLGDGAVIADGPADEILSGGWYFATEVARVLDLPGIVTPEQGAAVLAGEPR